ncbi:efflux RND transporter periplasmic adaptor subunit [Reyranella sp.]|uniref:efflux RND transporter periplasmic adaptor subunit n=1 Tax=Reyranella sp. TaxID=1929291 RepID=UPI003D11965F
MYRSISRLVAAAIIAVVGLAVAWLAHAHENHVHAEDKPAAAANRGSALSRAEATAGPFEMVVTAKNNAMSIYIDDFATNAPIANARVVIETPAGPLDATAKDGFYELNAPFLEKPGHYDLIAIVSLGQTTEVLPLSLDVPALHDEHPPHGFAAWLGSLPVPVLLAAIGVGVLLGTGFSLLVRRRSVSALVVLGLAVAGAPNGAEAHENHVHGGEKAPIQAPTGELAARLADGSLFVPKPVQRIFGIRTEVSEQSTFNRSVELPGRIIPDPNASGFVQAAVGGRLSAPPGGFPRLGTAVKAGDILAYVTPPIQAVDVSDMRQRQGELDQQIGIVERRVARYQQLVVSGAVARQQLEDAKSELEGLRDRRQSLDRSRREEALVAPVDGIVADGVPVAGQMAQPNAVVFHIVDPAKLWVEALSFTVVRPSSATARTASERTLPLEFRGSGFADRNQALPVHFAIAGDVAGLRAGQFVTVVASTDERLQGIAVPRSAVVRGANGQEFVFEHVSPERFIAKPVRIAPLDGKRVLIPAGLEPGKRIVVQGAALLDQVR